MPLPIAATVDAPPAVRITANISASSLLAPQPIIGTVGTAAPAPTMVTAIAAPTLTPQVSTSTIGTKIGTVLPTGGVAAPSAGAPPEQKVADTLNKSPGITGGGGTANIGGSTVTVSPPAVDPSTGTPASTQDVTIDGADWTRVIDTTVAPNGQVLPPGTLIPKTAQPWPWWMKVAAVAGGFLVLKKLTK